jgi:signal transduction histidine kinase
VILDSDPGSLGHARSWSDAAAIRRAHPELPVLMFTADPGSMAEARAGTTARSRAAGYAGVIDKPFLVVEFLATLKHAVDTQRPREQDGRGIAVEAISVFPELAGPASTSWGAADFFSMAVHELRTPLTSIDGHAQLAQRFLTKDPVRAAESLARIREQSKRMNRLIGDLLDRARVSVGALSLEVVTFDLGVACAITIGLAEHGETPRITFTTPAAVRVQGDPERIAQILGNLLDNAVRYSPPDSPVAVSLTVAGPDAEIRVTDQGVGVPDGERERIFAPFYRTSRTKEIAGTGLGLHISRRIAEQHHGRLWLESTSEAGSVFVLSLPLAKSRARTN